MNANPISWDFGPLGRQKNKSIGPVDGLITHKPQTLQQLAAMHGVTLSAVLESAHAAGPLSPVAHSESGEPLFDPTEVSRALIAAGHYPTIRGI
jgi:hypothetical protein